VIKRVEAIEAVEAVTKPYFVKSFFHIPKDILVSGRPQRPQLHKFIFINLQNFSHCITVLFHQTKYTKTTHKKLGGHLKIKL
jgi:hypothetical protein